MSRLVATYPEWLAPAERIGTTRQGRPIEVWCLAAGGRSGCKPGADRPAVLFTSLVHAREPATLMCLVHALRSLLKDATSEVGSVRQLLASRQLLWMPVANPDGYAWNERVRPRGGGMKRKNGQRTCSPPDTENDGVDVRTQPCVRARAWPARASLLAGGAPRVRVAMPQRGHTHGSTTPRDAPCGRSSTAISGSSGRTTMWALRRAVARRSSAARRPSRSRRRRRSAPSPPATPSRACCIGTGGATTSLSRTHVRRRPARDATAGAASGAVPLNHPRANAPTTRHAPTWRTTRHPRATHVRFWAADGCRAPSPAPSPSPLTRILTLTPSLSHTHRPRPRCCPPLLTRARQPF
jgi:hypothetical protein